MVEEFGDLICHGNGAPLKVITTGANVPDISKAIDLLDAVPPVAGTARPAPATSRRAAGRQRLRQPNLPPGRRWRCGAGDGCTCAARRARLGGGRYAAASGAGGWTDPPWRPAPGRGTGRRTASL
jgi:hypothetical protein